MKYKVALTKQAELDLRNLYEYIAYILLAPEAAGNQLKRIEKALKDLDELPNRFKVFEKEPWYSLGLHQMPVDNFIVFYIPEIEDKTVTIIRIMYGGRDIDKHLKETDQLR